MSTDPQVPRASFGDKVETGARTFAKVAIITVIMLAVGAALFYFLQATLPRMWSQSVAKQVQGGLIRGSLLGLFYGFVFTFIPLLVLFQARRPIFRSTVSKVVVVLVALLIAAPNWLTLMVVLSRSGAALAGQQTMNVTAPGFRWGTAIGAILAGLVALFIFFTGLLASARERKLEEQRMELAAAQQKFFAEHPEYLPPPKRSLWDKVTGRNKPAPAPAAVAAPAAEAPVADLSASQAADEALADDPVDPEQPPR